MCETNNSGIFHAFYSIEHSPTTTQERKHFMKRKNFKLMTCAITLLGFMALQNPLMAKAAEKAPANFKQTYARETSVNLQWDEVKGASTYEVELSTDKSNWIQDSLLANDSNAKCDYSVKETLNDGSTYYVKIRTKYENGSTSDWSDLLEVCTAPKKVTNATIAEQTDTSIKLTWTPSKGADYYEIRFDENQIPQKDAKVVAIVTTPYYVHEFGDYNEANGIFFIMPVRCSTVNNVKIPWNDNYTDVLVTLIPQAPRTISVAKQVYSKKQTTFTYDRAIAEKMTSVYELEICDSKGKKILTKETYSYEKPTITIKDKKLLQQPFQYRMRSGRLNQNDKEPVFGSWSPMQTYIPDAPCKKLTNKTKKTATLEFQKIKGAASYTVYYSKDAKNWKAVVKNTKKTKVKVKYTPKKKNYYYVKANKVKFGKQKLSSLAPKDAKTSYKFK